MKIKLKLSEKQIGALVYSFNQTPRTPPKERVAKVAKSVLDKVVLKVRKRQLEVQQDSNLFNQKKKFDFSLELVEAHFLEQHLVSMYSFPMCEYDKNAINQIASTLNQQLA
ncbi:hypothetical protein [Flavobacterium gilvum]|nr:hypothetical protein [Flavobacterium gilvum]KFC60000.1 hypothetical protein FEM08_11790 [Flavobacterium gilvum]